MPQCGLLYLPFVKFKLITIKYKLITRLLYCNSV
nr:MAG TPA_asm: hypothetical protein [Caudoviricetes sp.]